MAVTHADFTQTSPSRSLPSQDVDGSQSGDEISDSGDVDEALFSPVYRHRQSVTADIVTQMKTVSIKDSLAAEEGLDAGKDLAGEEGLATRGHTVIENAINTMGAANVQETVGTDQDLDAEKDVGAQELVEARGARETEDGLNIVKETSCMSFRFATSLRQRARRVYSKTFTLMLD